MKTPKTEFDAYCLSQDIIDIFHIYKRNEKKKKKNKRKNIENLIAEAENAHSFIVGDITDLKKERQRRLAIIDQLRLGVPPEVIRERNKDEK